MKMMKSLDIKKVQQSDNHETKLERKNQKVSSANIWRASMRIVRVIMNKIANKCW